MAWSMNRLLGLVGLMAISGSPDENPAGLEVICTWNALLGGAAFADWPPDSKTVAVTGMPKPSDKANQDLVSTWSLPAPDPMFDPALSGTWFV